MDRPYSQQNGHRYVCVPTRTPIGNGIHAQTCRGFHVNENGYVKSEARLEFNDVCWVGMNEIGEFNGNWVLCCPCYERLFLGEE